MSLFKAREWWSTVSGYEEFHDLGCLAVGNLDNVPSGLGDQHANIIINVSNYRAYASAKLSTFCKLSVMYVGLWIGPARLGYMGSYGK